MKFVCPASESLSHYLFVFIGFHCFSPVVSAAVFRGAVPDVFGFPDQFNFNVPALKLQQMTIVFPFTHAAYLHVVDHVPGDPGLGRHCF